MLNVYLATLLLFWEYTFLISSSLKLCGSLWISTSHSEGVWFLPKSVQVTLKLCCSAHTSTSHSEVVWCLPTLVRRSEVVWCLPTLVRQSEVVWCLPTLVRQSELVWYLPTLVQVSLNLGGVCPYQYKSLWIYVVSAQISLIYLWHFLNWIYFWCCIRLYPFVINMRHQLALTSALGRNACRRYL